MNTSAWQDISTWIHVLHRISAWEMLFPSLHITLLIHILWYIITCTYMLAGRGIHLLSHSLLLCCPLCLLSWGKREEPNPPHHPPYTTTILRGEGGREREIKDELNQRELKNRSIFLEFWLTVRYLNCPCWALAQSVLRQRRPEKDHQTETQPEHSTPQTNSLQRERQHHNKIITTTSSKKRVCAVCRAEVEEFARARLSVWGFLLSSISSLKTDTGNWYALYWVYKYNI